MTLSRSHSSKELRIGPATGLPESIISLASSLFKDSKSVKGETAKVTVRLAVKTGTEPLPGAWEAQAQEQWEKNTSTGN